MATNPAFDDLPLDIRELIRKPLGEIPLPAAFPLLPTAYYFGKCVDTDFNGVSKSGNRCWVFYCIPTELVPGQEVTQNDLASLDLSMFKFPSDRFYGVNGGTLWMIPSQGLGNMRVFFTRMGFPQTKPLEDCAVEMLGKNVYMEIGKEDAQNADGTPRLDAGGTKRQYNILISLAKDPRDR